MENIEQLAREVAAAQDRLELAKRKLLAALGGVSVSSSGPVSGTRKRAKTGKPVSVQLAEALQAAPNGLTRDELKARLGDTSALHSALKKAAETGKVSHSGKRGGPWKWVSDTKKKGPRP